MKLKLKDEPREWLKFTAVMALVVAIGAALLWRRQGIGPRALGWIGVALLGVLLVCAMRPRWFRGFYRAGMTVSWHVGQVMGRVLLTVCFLVVLTPLGLLLRVLGKDLLQLKRQRDATSYWKPVQWKSQLDRMF